MNGESEKRSSLVRCRCLFCGQLFWSERSTAEYHSASCKQKMYRWRKKLATQTEKVLRGIKEIGSYLTYDKSTPMAAVALHKIKAEIAETLLTHMVKEVK